MKKVAIIGAGGIANHLSNILKSSGIRVCFQLTRGQANEFEYLLEKEGPEAVFLSISTLDMGEAACRYILACAERGVPIITCEKGSLAYHAKVLKSHMGLIGFSAAVGGGTRMLKYVANRNLVGKQVDIQAVINGTLNFIFDEMSRGVSLSEACEEARRLGYAEPGAKDLLSLINGEIKDVRMKICVFFNTVLAVNKFITPDDLGLLEYSRKDMEDLSEVGGDYRFVVSFTNRDHEKTYPRFGRRLKCSVDGWSIEGSFRQIAQSPILLSWLPGVVGNAICITEGDLGSDGKYILSGPGAGHGPTTSAMLVDFCELCK